MRLYIANIHYDARRKDLEDFFRREGFAPERVDLAMRGGQPCGFGFADFGSPGEAMEAIKRLNGAEFRGRRLSVQRARSNAAAGGRS